MKYKNFKKTDVFLYANVIALYDVNGSEIEDCKDDSEFDECEVLGYNEHFGFLDVDLKC